MRDLVLAAIDRLCDGFEERGYHPTPIVELGALVASADGAVDAAERAMLLDLFQELFDTKLTPELVDHLVSASVEVIAAAGSPARARHLGAILHDCDGAEQGLVVAIAVAFASAGLSDAERAIIERIGDAAQLPRARIDALVARVKPYVEGDPISVRQSLAPGPKSRG